MLWNFHRKFTDLSGALKYLSQIPIKVKLQLLRKYQNIFQNIPNYQKVTNLKKHKYIVHFFCFPWNFFVLLWVCLQCQGVPLVAGKIKYNL